MYKLVCLGCRHPLLKIKAKAVKLRRLLAKVEVVFQGPRFGPKYNLVCFGLQASAPEDQGQAGQAAQAPGKGGGRPLQGPGAQVRT